MHLSVPVALLALAELGSCGGDDELSFDGPARVELGTGVTDFELLNEGQDIEVILGPQGGYHLIASLQARNLDPGNPASLSDAANPTTEFRVYSEGLRVDAMASRYKQGLRPGDHQSDKTYEMVGRLVILDIEDDQELVGKTIRVEVEVSDQEGRQAIDARELKAIPGANNP